MHNPTPLRNNLLITLSYSVPVARYLPIGLSVEREGRRRRDCYYHDDIIEVKFVAGVKRLSRDLGNLPKILSHTVV